jgi:phosphoserine phosphatase
MTDEVVIKKAKLRELLIAAEVGVDMMRAVGDSDGDPLKMLEGCQEALAAYMAKMAVSDARR